MADKKSSSSNDRINYTIKERAVNGTYVPSSFQKHDVKKKDANLAKEKAGKTNG